MENLGNGIYKDYIGDGVYVEWQESTIIIYISNGVVKSDPVLLEPEVFNALIRFQKRMMEIRNENKPE